MTENYILRRFDRCGVVGIAHLLSYKQVECSIRENGFIHIIEH